LERRNALPCGSQLNSSAIGRETAYNRPLGVKQSPSPNHEIPVESLREVGPQRAELLRGLGIRTARDLLEYFPRDYQFESEERPITALKHGEIGLARGEIVAVDFVVGRSMPRFMATLSDGIDELSLIFFNGGYLRRKLHPGLMIRVKGEVQNFRGSPQMVNPKWELVEENTAPILDAKLRPIYPATARLPSDLIERIIRTNLTDALAGIDEWFGSEIPRKRKLMGRRDAFGAIHQPTDRTEALHARRRLVYDELMLMQLGLALGHEAQQEKIAAQAMKIDKTLDERIRARFGFDLTQAQTTAIWEIAADLKRPRPMKRLLQGDVGSGKTVVALYAMLVAVANKMQAALLAPTEVLAEQHFLTLSNMLRNSRVNIELFTSRTRRQGHGNPAARLAEGKIDIAVGTQALLHESIVFSNLGIVVVDEQHRLGVQQRAILTNKGDSPLYFEGNKGGCPLYPHYLVMTATPIPRTLALSYFADFDLTTIDQLPPGRRPIETRWLRQSQSKEAYGFIRHQVAAGRQAYVVLPRVEDETGDDAKSVTRQFQQLSTGVLSGLRLAAMHGQLSTKEKQKAMDDFRAGRIDVLVATTVIEVGIDVPNASVILIDGAERFGLSQLHQLRGRVGRGPHESYCLLLADATTPGAEARLSALTKTSSGFEIAELDLQLRGPGEFFGTRQHGLPEFKLADLRGELDLLLWARQDATKLLEKRVKLNPALAAALKDQFGGKLQLARVG